MNISASPMRGRVACGRYRQETTQGGSNSLEEKTETNRESNQFDTTHSLGKRSNLLNRCLAAIARQRLDSSGYALLKLVQCEQKNGVIVIRGTVSSYFLKQIAQEQLRSIQGMTRIVNELEVKNEL